MPAWLAGLLEKFPFLWRHPHPMVVHFPIVFMYSATFFEILSMITAEKSFEMTAFYCLAGGILFTPLAMITGWFTWWLNYMAKPMGPVTIKKRLSWLLLVIAVAAFAWRFCVTDIMERPAPDTLLTSRCFCRSRDPDVIGYCRGAHFPQGGPEPE
jgi:uncharacterized membrane protein